MSKKGIWQSASVFCVDNICEDKFLFKEGNNGFTLAIAYDEGLHFHSYSDIRIIDSYVENDSYDAVHDIMSLVVSVMPDISYGTLVDYGGESVILIYNDDCTASLYNYKLEKIMEIDCDEDIYDYDDLDDEGKFVLELMKE